MFHKIFLENDNGICDVMKWALTKGSDDIISFLNTGDFARSNFIYGEEMKTVTDIV